MVKADPVLPKKPRVPKTQKHPKKPKSCKSKDSSKERNFYFGNFLYKYRYFDYYQTSEIIGLLLIHPLLDCVVWFMWFIFIIYVIGKKSWDSPAESMYFNSRSCMSAFKTIPAHQGEIKKNSKWFIIRINSEHIIMLISRHFGETFRWILL